MKTLPKQKPRHFGRGSQIFHGGLEAAGYSLTSILPFMAGCKPQM